MKKIVFIVLIVTILIVISITAFQTDIIPNVLTDVINRFRDKPEEGVIAVSGNVEIKEVNVGFTLSGRIVELLVEEDQEVEKDENCYV